MELSQDHKGRRKLSADKYALTFAADRPFVYLDDAAGERLAELFVLSSVHPRHDRDETVSLGTWEMTETEGEIVFSMRVQSSTWREKVYRLRCQPSRLLYEVEVNGQGQVVEANYFGGYYSGQVRWGSGFFWSGQHFQRGFDPEPNSDEAIYFGPAETAVVDIMGVPLPGRGDWFFTPPPFFFGVQGATEWMGLGVQAGAGQNHYTEYQYHGRRGSFYLSLNFEGHLAVDGWQRLPAIVFDFGPDEYATLAAYIISLHAADSLPRPRMLPRAAWWSEPIVCGWGAQCYEAAKVDGRAPDFSRQPLYNQLLQTLEDHDLSPGIVVLDDKWQSTYGNNRADEAKWPDLPGFVREQHAAGRKVLLWLKAWDPEGVPPEECVSNSAGMPVAVDPNNIAYEKRLRESIQVMLGRDGYDADGFKIDFTARIPSGPGLQTDGNAWGLELMKRYLGIIYSEAKLVKPEALVMTHTPNPYLADVVDMIRLNDINLEKDIPQAMRHRARVARIAVPAALIDTDNWPITNKAAWRDYVQMQPELGVPSMYYASHIDSTLEPLDASDYALLRESWERYRARRANSAYG